MTIVYSVLFMSLLGVGAGIFLAFASAKFAVKKDPRIALIEASLPGANCGACGFPGCAAFAKAVAEGKASIEGCIPGKRS
ncbi:MAG: H+/Na+-translocating ferredoxin:NAD+ oxidoreductase subunit, partial [Mesotoga sp.]|nr:H+/Na+-translocating ferredoxin:NAD+ oxidoreductase subunit [Mesotoga sp.]